MKQDEVQEIGKIISNIKKSGIENSTDQVLKLLECLIGSRVEVQVVDENKEKEVPMVEEHVREVTCMELALDWENLYDQDERTQGVHVESIADGLVMSLNNLGHVDIEYIASITGEDYKTVITTLKGAIYQNPSTWDECFYKGWETAEEYLSGNLMKKWKEAKKANKEYDGYFSDNVKALKKVLPKTVDVDDIYVTLGSPWLPTDIIDQFIQYLFGKSYRERYCKQENWERMYAVRHDIETGSWEIPEKGRYDHSVAVTNTYGTYRMEALHIIEKTLNMKTLGVYDSIVSQTTEAGVKKVLNQEETAAALEKQQKIISAFQDWIWSNPTRKKRLLEIFENQYSSVRQRVYDGSFLEFEGLTSDVELYPYQKNAIARILFSKNTLLAHDVGSGKTYVMIAAGMELRRMGLSKKNLYVVPNNIVGQWKNIFEMLYPSANVLCVEPRTFTREKRAKVLGEIKNKDYDGIIMAYSCFERITLSRKFYESELKAKKEQLDKILSDTKKRTNKTEKSHKKLVKTLSELLWNVRNLEGEICFDELGITHLFVDEAHNFKNLPLDSQIDKVLGIQKNGSKKCQDMMDKVHIVQRMNNGGGVVMATGTPITNSITDVFVFQKYLQDGELAMLDLQHFDSWVGMFAEKTTNFEVDIDTSGYRLTTRFAKFHNLPELTALLSSIADFHQVGMEAGIPDFDGYQDCLIGKTPEFEDYLKLISSRAEHVRLGCVNRKEDNMLKITTDGRKAALDIRLVNPGSAFTFQSKVARCAENVTNYYSKGTQLVFCDTSTPKNSFNLYDELKRLLVSYGISSEEIAYVHDATSEKKKNELFSKVRKGVIRVLIGSTFKLGLGVNVQDKLIAIHHLDVPWRPADMVQREGRILRQGNQNKKIEIYRYITEGSFDAYSWQLLETKQRFIVELLSGSVTARSENDIEDTILNYAEVKALAVGNPLVKERVEVANELSRFRMLQRKFVETKITLQQELKTLPGKKTEQRRKIELAQMDARLYKENKKEHSDEERKELRGRIHQAVLDNIFTIRDRELMSYQGFHILLPANMKKEKPFVWLRGEGKHYVELGDSEVGDLIRIDNFLENFDKYIERLYLGMEKLEAREQAINNELKKKDAYVDEIRELRQKLAEIDGKLGVTAA